MLDLPKLDVQPLSRWLAAETSAQHQMVEADLLPAGQVGDLADVVRLVQVHQRVLAAYAGVMDELVVISGAGRLAPWLVAADHDLRTWGVPAHLDTRPAWAPDRSFEYLIGVRYVMEGARMGLRVLADQASAVLAGAGKEPSMLLRADPDAGHRWHAVRRWLDDPSHHEIDREQVRRGAVAAFAAYRQ